MAIVTPSAPVQSAFYTQLQQQAQEQIGQALGNITPVPVEIGAQGQFPYFFRDPNNNFNIATWTFLNSTVVPGQAGGVQLGPSFSNAYGTLVGQLSWSLSSADQAQLNAANIKSQQQMSTVITQYEDAYGPITQAQLAAAKVTQKIDYIVSYQLNQWAGPNAPLLLTADRIRNLTGLLPALPPSAQPLIGPISQYLQVMVSVLGLINAGGNASTVLYDLYNNTITPSAGNGGIQTSDGATHVGFTMSPRDPAQIQSALSNTGSAVTITFHASDYNVDSTSLSVDGGGGGVIPIAEFIGIDIGGGATYNMHDLNTSGDSFDVTMTFTGVNLVNVTPVQYQIDTRAGWYDPAPIADAVANHGQDVSGYQLSPWPANIDFSDGGDFGLLTGLIISSMPTITINYEGGSATDAATAITEQASLGISLFGFRLGGVDQSYSHSTIDQHSTGGGFTVTFTPPPPSGNAMSQLAYVMAATVDYPGAGA